MAFKVVSGPPCSGKSTYVRENMGDTDVVFDYDRVSAALTSVSDHTVQGRKFAHRFVMDMRSSFVATAKKQEHDAENVWFILTNLTDGVRGWLADCDPEYIEMDVSEEVCLERLQNDDTRPDKPEWEAAIKKWFAERAGKKEEPMAKTIPIYITEEIKADEQVFNWQTGEYETIKSITSQRYFVDQLAGVTAADSVELYINSMGGSVKEAVGIYNVLRRCPAAVTAYIDGFAASAASVIAMAADKIIMPRNTCMMIHNAAWYTYGNPAQLRKSADDLEVLNKSVINSYVMHAGNRLPALELNRMLDAETWLTAEDCVKFGLADELAQDNADMTAAAQQFAAAAATGAAAYATVPDFLRAYLPQPAAKATGGEPVDPPEQKSQGQPPVNNRRSLAGLLAKTILNLEENNEK